MKLEKTIRKQLTESAHHEEIEEYHRQKSHHDFHAEAHEQHAAMHSADHETGRVAKAYHGRRASYHRAIANQLGDLIHHVTNTPGYH